MKRSNVAWEHLNDLEKAQLIKFYPELEDEMEKWHARCEYTQEKNKEENGNQ